MRIGGLQKTTLIDYPGKIAATVFFLGCTFRCPFCHNPELVLPERKDLTSEITEKRFFKFLQERKGLLEGVTLTGGEPTIYRDLPDFIKKIRNLGFLVKLDSNGTNPEMIERLFREKLVDYVAMDIKAQLKSQNSKVKSEIQNSKVENKYCEAAGTEVNMEKIKKSVCLIKNSGIDYEFRTTVVPGIHTKEDIIQIARDIAPAKRYYLQNFRPEKTIDPAFEKINPFSDKEMQEMKKAVEEFFEICEIR